MLSLIICAPVIIVFRLFLKHVRVAPEFKQINQIKSNRTESGISLELPLSS